MYSSECAACSIPHKTVHEGIAFNPARTPSVHVVHVDWAGVQRVVDLLGQIPQVHVDSPPALLRRLVAIAAVAISGRSGAIASVKDISCGGGGRTHPSVACRGKTGSLWYDRLNTSEEYLVWRLAHKLKSLIFNVQCSMFNIQYSIFDRKFNLS